MQSLWNDQEAANFTGALGLRVYTSQLLGRDRSLVLHGGGNTSVKIRESNIFGEPEDILYVKGSGWDLETIEAPGFSPVRMDHLLRLAGLEQLTDIQMVNELRAHMTVATAPTPSIEAILHAVLPFTYVDHSHADAVVTITNTSNGVDRIGEVYGNQVVIIPYVMPGFDLARVCAQRFAAKKTNNTIGMVLMNHGIFSFGETAQASYERMIELVDRAEQYLKTQKSWEITHPLVTVSNEPQRLAIAELRTQVSRCAGRPMLLGSHRDAAGLAFAAHEKVDRISQQGPATPDHVIRTKRLPMLGRNVKGYAQAYREYFEENAAVAGRELAMLDPCPRVVLDETLGLCTIGDNAKAADIVADIYQHTIDIILRATALGGYQALPAREIFAVEYWELEQAKLKRPGAAPVFQGEVALVTGAASGIGRACVDAFLRRGAAVIGLDIDERVTALQDRADFLGIHCDITDNQALTAALEQGIGRFGGLDMLVLNAGIFPASRSIAELDMLEWRKVMKVNLDANLTLLREAHPLLKLAPNKGRVVVIGSKNVPAPGPGAASYSASKAALNQVARIAALEWGADGIRINSLHPDAVFDTGIWSDDIIASRAAHYGMDVNSYKTKNILKTEIHSSDVAELATEMCGPLFSKTTAAQVPIDGGNDRVI